MKILRFTTVALLASIFGLTLFWEEPFKSKETVSDHDVIIDNPTLSHNTLRKAYSSQCVVDGNPRQIERELLNSIKRAEFVDDKHFELTLMSMGLPLHVTRMLNNKRKTGIYFSNNLVDGFTIVTGRNAYPIIDKLGAIFRLKSAEEVTFTESEQHVAYSPYLDASDEISPDIEFSSLSTLLGTKIPNEVFTSIGVYPNEVDISNLIMNRRFSDIQEHIDLGFIDQLTVFKNRSPWQSFFTLAVHYGDLNAAKYFAEIGAVFEPDPFFQSLPYLKHFITHELPNEWQVIGEEIPDQPGDKLDYSDYFSFNPPLTDAHKSLLASYDSQLDTAPATTIHESLRELIDDSCNKSINLAIYLNEEFADKAIEFGFLISQPIPYLSRKNLAAKLRGERPKELSKYVSPFDDLGERVAKLQQETKPMYQELERSPDYQRVVEKINTVTKLIAAGEIQKAIANADFGDGQQRDLNTLLDIAISEQATKEQLTEILAAGAAFSPSSFIAAARLKADYINMLVGLGMPLYFALNDFHTIEISYMGRAHGMIEAMFEHDLIDEAHLADIDLVDLSLKSVLQSRRNLPILKTLASHQPIVLLDKHYEVLDRIKAKSESLLQQVDQVIYQSLKG